MFAMTSCVLRCSGFSAVLGIFILLIEFPKGSIAAKKCLFNGVTYTTGQTVVSLTEVCTAVMCQPKVNKRGKVSKKHVELAVVPQDLTSCTCNFGAKFATDLRNLAVVQQEQPKTPSGQPRFIGNDVYPFGGQSRYVPAGVRKVFQPADEVRLPRHIDWKNGRRRGKPGKGLRGSFNGIKAKRNGKTCKFNKGKFTAGQIVYTLQERCLQLVCTKESKRVSTIQVQYIPACTCSGSVVTGVTTGSPVVTTPVSGSVTPVPNSSSNPGSNPSSAPTAAPTSAPTPAPSPTPTGSGGRPAGSAILPDCSKYSGFTSQHSACKPKSTRCVARMESVTEAEKQTILKVHNDYRAKVANGNENRGNPGPQPSATNMREIVWNDELAQIAQAWAFTCPNGHECYDCRKITGRSYEVGQNLYWSWNFSPAEEWNTAITAFYDEVAYVPNTLVDNYQSVITLNQIGHYTQLVWAETYEIGCGAIYYGPCASGLVNYDWCKTYVCDYGPAGNFLGNPIYEKGTTASNCANGKSNTYAGLCK